MAVHSVSNGVPNGTSNGTSNSTSNGVSNGVPSGTDRRGSPSSPIAIVGMSCRFAGDASSPSKLWELCASGRAAWSPIPLDRLDIKSFYHPDKDRPGRSHALGGHFFGEDPALFDAAFFNFSADVASAMDPQLRLLLECVYESMEDAGIPLDKIAGSNTSVFTGCYGKDYHELQARDPDTLPASFLTGNGTAMLSNRVSHFYDLQGASMSIDTGCSSGLVALHQACRTLHTGESDISIVGATSAMLSPDLFIAMSSLSMVGADGRCYAWDARAHGYGRGEGVAALVLKPLDAALKAGDHIHAVVRETGLNQDGKTTTITSPSPEAQVRLIEQCYRRAGLDMAETGYVEAHMTGTPDGDAAEAEALARTFGKGRNADDPVLVGSVKTNVGHTEPVSGLAAIIKAAYAMQKRQIPKNMNYEIPNPKIPLEEWKLKVPTALTEWPHDKPLRASINNFGYGGTNAHVILEAAPAGGSHLGGRHQSNGFHGDENGAHNTDERPRVFVLSARDAVALQGAFVSLAGHLRNATAGGNAPPLGDLAYTLAERRSRLPWLAAVRAGSIEELAERLEHPSLKPTLAAEKPRLGFVFNGQGAQWHAMGRELISYYPVFADSVRRADSALRAYGASWSLHEELMRDAKSTRVNEIELSQPITVALQLCLVDLLRSWNIRPSAVTSHSSGEIAAAYAVGFLSFDEALGTVYYRGELALQHQKAIGGMAAVGLGPEEAGQYLVDGPDGRVVVACVNSQNSVTLSGDLGALEKVVDRLQADGVFARKLKVPLAYHSHHMLAMAPDYTEKLRAVLPAQPSWTDVIFASPVTGDLITNPEALTPEHWVQNLTSPVLFSQAFEAMCFGAEPDHPGASASRVMNVDMIVEVGAHGTLAGPIRQILRDRSLPYVSCLQRSVNAVETMQILACDLLARGYPVDLEAVNFPSSEEHAFVYGLPTYSWNHNTRYWTESRISREFRQRTFEPHELLGSLVPGCSPLNPTWRNNLRLPDVSWLIDHQVDSGVVLPGTAYVAMAIEAARLLRPAQKSEEIRGFRLRDVEIKNALAIPTSSSGVETQLCLRPVDARQLDHEGWFSFEVLSLGEGNAWVENCRGFVSVVVKAADGGAADDFAARPAEVPRRESFFPATAKVKKVDVEELLGGLREMTIEYGPSFRNLTDCEAAGNKAVAGLSISHVASETSGYIIHPTTLDSIIQAAYNGLPQEVCAASMVIPKSIGTMFVPQAINKDAGDKLRVFTEMLSVDRRGFTSKVAVTAEDEDRPDAVFEMERFFAQAVPRAVQSDGDGSGAGGVCSKSTWEVDILSLFPDSLKGSLKTMLNGQDADHERKMARASFLFIQDAARELEGEDPESWPEHSAGFYSWMKDAIVLASAGALAPRSKSWAKTTRGARQMLVDELNSSNAAGKLLVRVGPKLASIVRGETDPLDLVKRDDLLTRYFDEAPRLASRTYRQLAQVLSLYAVARPGANVLEVGGGAGAVAKVAMEAFAAKGDGSGSLVGNYTFTDSSPQSLDAAKQRLARWEPMVDFRLLDIDADPAGQDFTGAEYDLVVASTVNPSSSCLAHIRKLLKPGGRLLLVAPTRSRAYNRIDARLIFGTIPSWRHYGEGVDMDTLQGVLRDAGFVDVDLDVADCEEPEYQSTALVLASAETIPLYPRHVSIVHATPPPPEWLAELCRAIEHKIGVAPLVESVDRFQSVDDKVAIFVAEVEQPFVHGMDRAAFEALQRLLLQGRGVFWVSSGGIIDAERPVFAESQGLLRTLRQEDASKRYVQLDFSQSGGAGPWSGDKVEHIARIFAQTFDYSSDPADMDTEYAVKDSVVYVPRIVPDVESDAVAVAAKHAPTPTLQPFQQPGRPLVWDPTSAGFTFTDDHAAALNREDDAVEVEPKAYGVGIRDMQAALGQERDEGYLGYDFAGVVTRVGPLAEQHGLRVGDRVCGIVSGPIATLPRAPWTSVVKLPDGLSFEEGASIPTAYATAYHALAVLARLQRGEAVLIQDAAGAVGQAAVVVAQHLGAEILATCSTRAERDLLAARYALDPARIFPSRSFGAGVLAGTGGRGADVVLNSGPLRGSTWECVSAFGRLVDAARPDAAGRQLDMRPFGRSASYAGLNILQLGRALPGALQGALRRGLQMATASPLPPVRVSPISAAVQAVRLTREGAQTGRLVLVPRAEDQVNVVAREKPLSLDGDDASYLIVGGLGGIGRAVASWMVEKGAKNLILTSRNAEVDPNAGDIIRAAKADGCNIRVRSCDVSDSASLGRLVEECGATMPPIRGVVNAAMVLDDTVLERMTFDQWTHAIRPKVDSSINLHEHLPGLQFFIMLSSVTGVAGHPSQANYAAGNAFQDALGRHRAAKGQPAVVLDLGAVESVGVVAESDKADEIRARIHKIGASSVPLDVVLRLLEGAIREPARPSPDASQVIVGMARWEDIPEDSATRRDRRFGTLRLGSARRSGPADDSEATPAARLVRALSSGSVTSLEEVGGLVADVVAFRLADVFSVGRDKVDLGRPLAQYGVDSLVAVDLRNWLASTLRAKVSIFEILQSGSVGDFGALVASRSEYLAGVVKEA